jgi:hypothetical protein
MAGHLVMPYITGGSLKDVLKCMITSPKRYVLLQKPQRIAICTERGLIHRYQAGNTLRRMMMHNDFGLVKVISSETEGHLLETASDTGPVI